MKFEPTAPLSARLREAVLPTHRRIETLPFFAALTAHVLPVERYVDQLRAMAIVETTLERAAGASPEPAIATARAAASPQAGLLLDDLARFDHRGPMPDDPAPTAAALHLAGEIRLAGAERPLRLIGFLYVSQGVTLGNLVHREDAIVCAGPDGGTTWYSGNGAEAGSRFRAFCAALDDLPLDEGARREAVEAAVSAVAGYERIHQALDPALRPERRYLATTYNAEAGAHGVPAGAAESAAALRAGERCLEEYPYFLERWGERGRRYTRSDVGWLATLASLPRSEASQQVRWLAGVLARRGMPSILLERQLALLEEELCTALPSGSWGHLGDAARDLAARRLEALPEAAAGPLGASFAGSAGHRSEVERHRAARLLLSAVVDESTGFPGAVAASTAWFRSEAFPVSWNESVDTLLRHAFAAVRTGHNES